MTALLGSTGFLGLTCYLALNGFLCFTGLLGFIGLMGFTGLEGVLTVFATMDDLNFFEVRLGMRERRLKSHQKLTNFCCFWTGLPNTAADCSPPCEPIWLKFYIVNGLG